MAPVVATNSTVGTETKFVPVIVIFVAVLGNAKVGLMDEYVGASLAKTTSAGNRAAGTVPLARFEAFMFDRSLPSIAPVRATVVLESPRVRVFELLGNIVSTLI